MTTAASPAGTGRAWQAACTARTLSGQLCWLARAKGKAGRRGSQGMHWLQDTAEALGLVAVGTRPPVQPGYPAHHPMGGISLMPTVPLEKD